MPPSLLFLPPRVVLGQPGPAVLFAHRWNGYPYDRLARRLGERLADAGWPLLALGLRRRGVEGSRVATPDDDLRDLKLGIDYLASSGASAVLLVGEEIGGLSVARYQAATRDLRVKGVAIVRPFPDLADWLRVVLGAERYAAEARQATVAARQLLGLDHLIDLQTTGPDGQPFVIFQYAAPWLAWWGPLADTKLSRVIEEVTTPLLVVAGPDRALAETLAGRAACSPRVSVAEADAPETVAERLLAWAAMTVRPPGVPAPMRLVSIPAADGTDLVGLLYQPAERTGPNHDLAIVHVRGWTGIPLGGPVNKLAPVYAAHGITALTFEMRRSGVGGDLVAYFEWDLEDIDAVVRWLAEQGYRRIVLAGHSLGSVGVTVYTATRKHPNVVANVHYAPTADTPLWVRKGLGDARYDELVARARAAVAAGHGERDLIEAHFRDYLADDFHRPVRVPKRAGPWLSWWGPDALSVNSRFIGEVETPILLLCGSEDQYNTRERLNLLQALAVKSPDCRQVWYDDCDHGFTGFEEQTAEDVLRWLAAVGILPADVSPSSSARQ
jgi:dienelactone hydrolase